MVPYAHTLLADAHRSAGHIDEALNILEQLETARDPAEVRFVDRLIRSIRSKLSSC